MLFRRHSLEELVKFEAAEELEGILSFWRRMQDETEGGFYCGMDYNLVVDRAADKSGVSLARILWTFSSAYRMTEQKNYLDIAHHAYAMLARNLIDSVHGGAYWMLDYQGSVIDNRKHIYLQAFCIYALSEYYLASGTRRSIELAMKIWHIVEDVGYDVERNAYLEEFTREWEPKENELLSEKGLTAEITANTHLHLLEAYTVLYRATPMKPVRESLLKVLGIISDRIYSPERRSLGTFFDGGWNELTPLVSFGHDIEASRLIGQALKVLSLKDEGYQRIIAELADGVLEHGVQADGSVINELDGETEDAIRIWWVQAEAATGFLSAWESTGDERFYKAFCDCWLYIREHIVDHRPGGEWLYGRNIDGSALKLDVAGPWKTPYHNGRCCLELLSRF